MDLSQKKKIFQQYNTDPYTLLNVSQNCSKQELDLSYQQAYSVLKRIPGQESQIKLLKEAYKIIESDLRKEEENRWGSTPEPHLVTSPETSRQMDRMIQDRSFHKTDFTNYNNRQALFADDTLNFQQFEQQLNNKKTMPVSTQYTPENVKGERLFETGNFNIDTFNEKFEERFSILGGNDDSSSIPAQGVDSFSSMSYMPICSYNGLIIEDKEQAGTFKNLQPVNEITKNSVPKKTSKRKVKEEDIKKLYDKRASEVVTVDTTNNFAEINRIMEQNQLNSMKSQLEYNKNKIMKNISVFPQSIVEQFQMGILEDSSTCIDGDSLVIPKGRRRE